MIVLILCFTVNDMFSAAKSVLITYDTLNLMFLFYKLFLVILPVPINFQLYDVGTFIFDTAGVICISIRQYFKP